MWLIQGMAAFTCVQCYRTKERWRVLVRVGEDKDVSALSTFSSGKAVENTSLRFEPELSTSLDKVQRSWFRRVTVTSTHNVQVQLQKKTATNIQRRQPTSAQHFLGRLVKRARTPTRPSLGRLLISPAERQRRAAPAPLHTARK